MAEEHKDAERRMQCLQLASEYHQGRSISDVNKIVEAAKKFKAFVKGDA